MEKSCVTFLVCDPGWYAHKSDVQNKWDDSTHTHMLHIRPIRVDASYLGPHPIVKWSDDYYHVRWYSNASEYLPQKIVVDSIVRLMKVS